MPRTLSGLNTGEFDTIEIYHNLTVGGVSGQPGTVLTSDGSNINWAPVTLDANAVTNSKINNNAVTNLKINDGAVTFTKIANGAVGEPKIGSNAVTTDKILNLNVTNAKLQHSSITLNGTEVALGGTHNHTTSLSGTADGDINMDSHNINNVGTVTATTGDFTNISVGNAVVSSTPAPSNYLRVPSGITTFDTGTTYGPIYTGHLFSGDISSSGNIVTLGNIVVGATGSITGWGTANISDINTVSANTGNFTNSLPLLGKVT